MTAEANGLIFNKGYEEGKKCQKQQDANLLENLIRLVDRIEENDLQRYFPSALNRAKEAIKKATL